MIYEGRAEQIPSGRYFGRKSPLLRVERWVTELRLRLGNSLGQLRHAHSNPGNLNYGTQTANDLLRKKEEQNTGGDPTARALSRQTRT
ncbi:hypothetical protein CDAR_8791 [Caerostris darwini]|uniref:Uncharacterized protein n=1 Tax=Caerostris darwini TaxID=1538125 RepID=A0AAV4R1T9_9ARAC|nr:hypothetical protein CDAR_8791 [Caerostris darwini]